MRRFGRWTARALALIAVAALAAVAGAQESKVGDEKGSSWGAPPPGMAVYYMGILRRGPSWTPEKTPETERIQAGHMAHIRAMAETGKLVGAGPFGDDGEIRGLFIFRTDSLEEATRLAGADPAVKAGRLKLDIHPWWGPVGVGDGYKAKVKADPKAQVPMVTYQLAFLTRGPSWTAEETPEIARLQVEHLAHIREMGESGKLVAAGPFTDGGDLRGVLVFAVATAEEAKAMAAGDPMVKAGRLALDFHPWWVADGVMP